MKLDDEINVDINKDEKSVTITDGAGNHILLDFDMIHTLASALPYPR